MLWKRFRAFQKKYERFMMPGALLLGFLVDTITLSRVDGTLDNIILFSYLLLAGISITILSLLRAHKIPRAIKERVAIITPLVLQYAFGGLFSGFIIFYTQSATLVTGWPFLLALIGLFIGNEVFKDKYSRPLYHLSIFFVALFSFAIFFIPILVKHMGAWVFVLSGITTLLITASFLWILRKINEDEFDTNKTKTVRTLLTIFILFNVLYFTNVIPPLPLSLKDSGIYHNIERSGNDFIVSSQKPRWFRFFSDYATEIELPPGQPLYAYSAIFAPTDLETTILHRWSYRDPQKHEWVTILDIPFPITGGREDGYRGFTFSRNIWPGRWRLDVITKREQLLGRTEFEIIRSFDLPELRTFTK